MKIPGLAKLPSDGNPRWVGVDIGRDDVTAECEFEVQPDGTIVVLDLRHIPDLPPLGASEAPA